MTMTSLSQFNHKHPRFLRLRRRAINDKSHPNSTTNIHDSSGYAGGAAQIPQVNAINDNDKSFTIQPQPSMILQVMLEMLPKFHRQTQLLTSLIPIQPQTSTIHQVTPEALPKFHFFKSLLVGGRLSFRCFGASTFGRVQSSICRADSSRSRQGPS